MSISNRPRRLVPDHHVLWSSTTIMSESWPARFQKMQRDALQARRKMIRDGELLTVDEFCARRGIGAKQLRRLTASGSVFFIEIDGRGYYPALLAKPSHNARRLAAVCRILWPGDPMSRLSFLTSRRGSLGGVTPLEAMQSDDGYRRLRQTAKGWAAEWSRTVVEIYLGEYVGHEAEGLPLVCTAVVEVDPRVNVLKRASCAVHDDANTRPDGPYPHAKLATVLVLRDNVCGPKDVLEARLNIVVEGGRAHCGVLMNDYPRYDLEAVKINSKDDVVTMVRRLLASYK